MRIKEMFGIEGCIGRKIFVIIVAVTVIMSSVAMVSPVSVDAAASKKKASVVKIGKATVTTSNGKVVVSKKNKVITIKKSGTYTLKGNFASYRILMNSRKLNVVLRLNGVTMKNSKTACIYNTKKSANLNIQLVKGTKNNLTGPAAFPVVLQKTGGNKVVPDAVVMSDGNLSFSGSGNFNVKDVSSNGNAIDSKKDIKISSGDIYVVSKNNGLNGDNVIINGGDLSVSSSDTGIKASQKVSVNAGSVDIDAVDKGIQGRMGVDIKNGTVSIKTRRKVGSGFEDFRGIAAGRSDKNGKQAVAASINISGGKLTISSYGDCIHASQNVNINGGTLNLTSTTDDGIQAKQTVTIKSSVKISISAKGKKIKADKKNIASNIKV